MSGVSMRQYTKNPDARALPSKKFILFLAHYNLPIGEVNFILSSPISILFGKTVSLLACYNPFPQGIQTDAKQSPLSVTRREVRVH